MRIFSRTGIVPILLVAVMSATAAVMTADLRGAMPAQSSEAEPAYASPIEAYRRGLEALRNGERDDALPALEFAAERGILGAQLRLARIYAVGDGAERDDVRAFRYYRRIADQYADASTLFPVGRYVAEAFVAVGRYHLAGVPEIGLRPDANRAADMFRHAASYFGDADAQYHLARLYLEGAGVHANVRLAVNWLVNAAKKQHAPSQALLGDILWHGHEDVRRRPLKGLALLALARRNATGTEAAVWIEPLYRNALREAEPHEREGANKALAEWREDTPLSFDAKITIEMDDNGADEAVRDRPSEDAASLSPVVPSVAVSPAMPLSPAAAKR